MEPLSPPTDHRSTTDSTPEGAEMGADTTVTDGEVGLKLQVSSSSYDSQIGSSVTLIEPTEGGGKVVVLVVVVVEEVVVVVVSLVVVVVSGTVVTTTAATGR